MEKCIIVFAESKNWGHGQASGSLEELESLARTAGADILGCVKCLIEKPSASHYIRRGKLEELTAAVARTRPVLVIFNVDLTATQARNIEGELHCRVVDRTGLILDIFARRAVSHDGKLQVELAQLNYLLPRLRGHGVLLSRLGGGIGTRGPGEQKLEIDRRRIRERITRLKKELVKLRKHRALLRQGRRRREFDVVAIVGYTNAGKSTLINALTGSKVRTEDKLFATLDPSTKGLRPRAQASVNGKKHLLFTDTVGFIVNLPHGLVEAFQATLEEIKEASLVLHVVDASHPEHDQQVRVVRQVLKELGAEEIPRVIALNKVDLIAPPELKRRLQDTYPSGVFISAKGATGLNELVEKIHQVLN